MLFENAVVLQLFPLLSRYHFPGTIRIETLHFPKFVESCRPKILLVNNTIVADDKALHSRYPIFGWRSNQREAPDHQAFHHEVHLSERRRGSLPLQDFEEIAMVWLRSGGVALLDRTGNFFANRPAPSSVRVLPCQAILFVGSAYYALRVLVHVVTLPLLECVIALCFHVAVADINRVQFIASDATVEEFLPAGFGIERPIGALLHDWHGERPVFVTHKQECAVASLGVHGNSFLFAGLDGKVSGSPPVLWVFAGEIDV